MTVARRAASWWLLAAGCSCAAIAALHVVLLVVGAPAYRYFGGGDRLAQLAESGSITPALLTACVAAVLAVFAWYAFAGAAIAVRPPLLLAGLVCIATVFLLRGISVFPQVASLLSHPGSIPLRFVAYSAVSFLVGLCYAAGTWRRWHFLRLDRGNAG